MGKEYSFSQLTDELVRDYDVEDDENAQRNIRQIIVRFFSGIFSAGSDFYAERGISFSARDADVVVTLTRSDCLKVLDLGCGSTDAERGHRPQGTARQFEPWLCRALHKLGLSPVGIDIHLPNNGELEEWEFHQQDLLVPTLVETFERSTFDLINIDRLLPGQESTDTMSRSLIDQVSKLAPLEEFALSLMIRTILSETLELAKDGALLFMNKKCLRKSTESETWENTSVELMY